MDIERNLRGKFQFFKKNSAHGRKMKIFAQKILNSNAIKNTLKASDDFKNKQKSV